MIKRINGKIINIIKNNFGKCIFLVKEDERIYECMSNRGNINNNIRVEGNCRFDGKRWIFISKMKKIYELKNKYIYEKETFDKYCEKILDDREFNKEIIKELYENLKEGEFKIEWIEKNMIYPEMKYIIYNLIDITEYMNMIRMTETNGERVCRIEIEKIYKKSIFVKTRPKFLINPKTGRRLEIDLYCEELKIGIEYNDSRHYKNKKQMYRDEIKKKICEKMGIKLISIPYNCENIYLYLIDKLK